MANCMGCSRYDPLSTSLYCINVCLKQNQTSYKKIKVRIYNVTDVSTFVAKAIKVEKGDVTVRQGRYIIDGKSLMGVFSLKLDETIEVEYPEFAFELEDFLKKFKAE